MQASSLVPRALAEIERENKVARGWLRGGEEGGDKGERWGKWKRRELFLRRKSNSRDAQRKELVAVAVAPLSLSLRPPSVVDHSCPGRDLGTWLPWTVAGLAASTRQVDR